MSSQDTRWPVVHSEDLARAYRLVLRSFPKEIDRHDIERIVKAFGDAAVRCREGGLDGLETMTAGHLIGQFFSPLTNQRTDEFGGSRRDPAPCGKRLHRRHAVFCAGASGYGSREPA